MSNYPDGMKHHYLDEADMPDDVMDELTKIHNAHETIVTELRDLAKRFSIDKKELTETILSFDDLFCDMVYGVIKDLRDRVDEELHLEIDVPETKETKHWRENYNKRILTNPQTIADIEKANRDAAESIKEIE